MPSLNPQAAGWTPAGTTSSTGNSNSSTAAAAATRSWGGAATTPAAPSSSTGATTTPASAPIPTTAPPPELTEQELAQQQQQYMGVVQMQIMHMQDAMASLTPNTPAYETAFAEWCTAFETNLGWNLRMGCPVGFEDQQRQAGEEAPGDDDGDDDIDRHGAVVLGQGEGFRVVMGPDGQLVAYDGSSSDDSDIDDDEMDAAFEEFQAGLQLKENKDAKAAKAKKFTHSDW